jgi:hypothetical protein
MRELRILTVLLLAVGIIGIVSGAWMRLGPNWVYQVQGTTVVESIPGLVKLRTTRSASCNVTVTIRPELYCMIGDTDTITPLQVDTLRVPKGVTVYDRALYLPETAFNGNLQARCAIRGSSELQPIALLPPLYVQWETEVFTAYRPRSD